MAVKANQKEIEFIIRVLEPEQRANGTLAIHCRKVPTVQAIDRKGDHGPEMHREPAASAQRKRHERAAKMKRKVKGVTASRMISAWTILTAVFAASASYLTLASAEFTRRGYFSVGGELIFSIGIGYLVYYLLGMKKSHRAQ